MRLSNITLSVGLISFAAMMAACVVDWQPRPSRYAAGPYSSAPPEPIVAVTQKPTAVAPPPKPPSFPASPLSVVLDQPADNGVFSVVPMGKRTVVMATGADGTATVLGEAKGPDVTFDAANLKGFDFRQMFTDVHLIGGIWPDNAFAAVIKPIARTGYSEIYQWTKDHWKQVEATGEGWIATNFLPWVGGSTLIVKQQGMMSDVVFEVKGGQNPGPAPRSTKSFTAKPTLWGCKSVVRSDVAATLPTGHLFSAGVWCDETRVKNGASGLAVERWAPGKADGVIDGIIAPREDAHLDVVGLAVVGPQEAYLATREYNRKNNTIVPDLFAFDGKTWAPMALPSQQAIKSLSATSDGTLWLGCSGAEVWKRSKGADWERVHLPAEVMTMQKARASFPDINIMAVGPDDVWITVHFLPTSKNKPHLFALHTQKPSKPLQLPKGEDVKRELISQTPAGPPSPSCVTPFVLMYTLSKVAPANYDYPATRAALKGHKEFGDLRFIEFQRGTTRYFGAKFPVFDGFDRANKLAELIKKGVPGSTPQVVCHDPEESRVLKIDLETGNLTP